MILIIKINLTTGESVPVTKTPLPGCGLAQKCFQNEEKEPCYEKIMDKRHTLFNGTKVIQTRYYGKARVLAVVVCTGLFK